MKHLVILLTIGFLAAGPVTLAAADDAPKSSAELRVEKKEAAAWYKKKLARQKKAIAALKKVKDEKSAKKAAASIMKLYGHMVGGEQTAMGTAGPAEVPSGEAADEVAAKYEKQLDKLQQQLNNEIDRIGGLELSVPELDEAIEAVNKY